MPRLLLICLLLLPTWGFAQQTYELPGGAKIQAYLTIPKIASEKPLPLVVVMGGGAGNGSIASSTFENLGQQFASRGWAVVVPVSPNGQSFWGVNADKVRQLITLLKERAEIDNGKVLLAGISNGGISALEIASLNPEDYFGVVAVPALASNPSQLRTLAQFPVYLRIGREDQLGWGERYDATVAVLESVGAKLDAQLLNGTGHTFPMNWDDLESWLASLPVN